MKQSPLIALFLNVAISLGATGAHPARAQFRVAAITQEQGQPPNRERIKPLSIRLRSFIVGASATLSFEPTISGGLVRLTTLGLPKLQALLPGAQGYFVWAVASGLPPIRVGQLQTDAQGNGGLEFARPEPLERYSVVVTAELSDAPKKPAGMVLFSTWLGEARAFFGTRDKSQDRGRSSRMSREIRKRVRLQSAPPDFYTEVDDALNLSLGGGRTIELFGDEASPDAYGLARVTALNNKAYLRAMVTRLPPPQAIGANTYILWGIKPDGRISYMGSLPSEDVNDKDIYVRVGGFSSDKFNLFVTAEKLRPVASPTGPRALATRSGEAASQ